MSTETILENNFGSTYIPEIVQLVCEYAYELDNSTGLSDELHDKITRKFFTKETVLDRYNGRYELTLVLDKFHSLDDEPAFIGSDGTRHWYKNDKRHRINGPASIFANGRLEWFVNGKRHNVNGPAVIDENGSKCWYINGEYLWD